MAVAHEHRELVDQGFFDRKLLGAKHLHALAGFGAVLHRPVVRLRTVGVGLGVRGVLELAVPQADRAAALADVRSGAAGDVDKAGRFVERVDGDLAAVGDAVHAGDVHAAEHVVEGPVPASAGAGRGGVGS